MISKFATNILVLVAPTVKGASPWLEAGIDAKVFAKLALNNSQRGAPATLQVLLGMVCCLCERIL